MASMSDHVVKVRAELEGVTVRPGDTLVIAFSRSLTQQEAHEIRERIAGQLPGVRAVIIAGASGLAAYRPHEDSDVTQALREIWNRIEESDEAISPAWLRRVIVESGAWKGAPDEMPPLADRPDEPCARCGAVGKIHNVH